MPDGGGVPLPLRPPPGRLDLHLEFCQGRGRDFPGFDGLGDAAEESSLEVFHQSAQAKCYEDGHSFAPIASRFPPHLRTESNSGKTQRATR